MRVREKENEKESKKKKNERRKHLDDKTVFSSFLSPANVKFLLKFVNVPPLVAFFEIGSFLKYFSKIVNIFWASPSEIDLSFSVLEFEYIITSINLPNK